MAKALDPAIAKVFKEMDMDPKDAVWDCHGTWVAYHRALEKVASLKGIVFERPAIIEAKGESGVAAMCVFGTMGDKTEWSVGEAAPGNNKNAYPWAMAEKRAKDRVILKLIGLHGEVYSEEEADDFKKGTSPKGSDTPIKTTGKPAPQETDWTGPLGKTKLYEELRRLCREFQKCFDEGDLDSFMALKSMAETTAIIKQAKVDMPKEWAGPLDEGEPYKDFFAGLEKELKEANPVYAG